jgi:DNA-binding transcriptional ArsR family regulator
MKTTNSPGCAALVVHADTVRRVIARVPAEELLYELADFFKVLGDTTRARILSALLVSELCVCDLSAVLGLGQSAVSHQLRVLRQAKLVRYRRSGKTVCYSLHDRHVKGLLATGLAHVKEG